jgi:DNA-binding transcriptional MerR regulator
VAAFGALYYCLIMFRSARQYLTTAEVARTLGVSTQTIYNWLRAGKISEPERNPLTAYRMWTVKDVDMVRMSISEVRSR